MKKLQLLLPLLCLPMSMVTLASEVTQISFFRPYTQSGFLDGKLIVAQRSHGSCWTRSISDAGRPDAWRCQANNLILDPCFQDSTNVACINSPWTNKVTVLDLSTPLPNLPPAKLNTKIALPWGVELANGQRCTFLPGATGLAYNMRLNYACDNQEYNIIGTLDKSSSLWKANYYNLETKKVTKEDVKRVWY